MKSGACSWIQFNRIISDFEFYFQLSGKLKGLNKLQNTLLLLPEILMLAKARILIVITGNQHMASVSTIKKNLFANPRSLDVLVALFRVFYKANIN